MAGSGLEHALERVGDRWSLLVVESLLDRPRRFGELASAMPGIAPNILTARLRSLQREGIVVARPYSRRPVRLSYELSASGRELAGALLMLAQWGARATGDAETPRHASCGTPMDARWYCPTCARAVDEHEASDVRFV
ncbi:MAG: winged helix-turn-helix transcriptional regulator [Actinomycetota bacterium]